MGRERGGCDGASFEALFETPRSPRCVHALCTRLSALETRPRVRDPAVAATAVRAAAAPFEPRRELQMATGGFERVEHLDLVHCRLVRGSPAPAPRAPRYSSAMTDQRAVV